MESSLREGLDDVIREIMENINTYSRQRGRVIEYRELLYGYSRVNSMHGHDLILDLLLVYKKYRGKKMTVPVRKHLYIQRSFTETRIREIGSHPDTAYRDFGKWNKSMLEWVGELIRRQIRVERRHQSWRIIFSGQRLKRTPAFCDCKYW